MTGIRTAPIKRRFIVVYGIPDRSEKPTAVSQFDLHIETCTAEDLLVRGHNSNSEDRTARLLRRTHNPSSYLVFLGCLSSAPSRVIAASVLHRPSNIEWHDGLPTRPGEARLGMSYVEPDFRGRGIRKSLMRAQLEFCEQRGYRAWSVIEAANVSSLRSSIGYGAVVNSTNYLLKVLAVNVISFSLKPAFFSVFGIRLPFDDYSRRLCWFFGSVLKS
ncbi:GNAT family N-acetyltransferase [Dietzia maris]|uniref:GNAT family N-acetyltransferase n=1 Tax=Dietzia maris TaxID=37915 RepID=UPI0035560A54